MNRRKYMADMRKLAEDRRNQKDSEYWEKISRLDHKYIYSLERKVSELESLLNRQKVER